MSKSQKDNLTIILHKQNAKRKVDVTAFDRHKNSVTNR